MMHLPDEQIQRLLQLIHKLVLVIVLLTGSVVLITLIAVFKPDPSNWFKKSATQLQREEEKKASFEKWEIAYEKEEEARRRFWHPASLAEANLTTSQKNQIEYGRELIMHTAKYLGPHGSVANISNGMNCQNCHLDAGTKIWGNNYGAVFATYPKYRARSGTEEDIFKRINDCFERSLNGQSLPHDSPELLAIKAYIEFIGSGVAKGVKPEGSGIIDLPWPDRVLDTTRGHALFLAKCQSCHQVNGGGLLAENHVEYIYPPLWGEHAYNQGAGLYRMSRFAGYIKYNMPQGVSYLQPQLSDVEAWDIAAFVNSQPRPSKDLSKDWPKIAEKPIDHPFGPYADRFSAYQHKYGPFKPIADEKKKKKEKERNEKNKPV